jgi:hypothetical protein
MGRRWFATKPPATSWATFARAPRGASEPPADIFKLDSCGIGGPFRHCNGVVGLPYRHACCILELAAVGAAGRKMRTDVPVEPPASPSLVGVLLASLGVRMRARVFRQHTFFPEGFHFVLVLLLLMPPRPDVPSCLARCWCTRCSVHPNTRPAPQLQLLRTVRCTLQAAGRAPRLDRVLPAGRGCRDQPRRSACGHPPMQAGPCRHAPTGARVRACVLGFGTRFVLKVSVSFTSCVQSVPRLLDAKMYLL